MATAQPKEFTGRKMLLAMLAFFGVIIAVNVFMAYSAVSTFPGLEVENSYVESQHFDERAAAQRALGWQAAVGYEAGSVVLHLQESDGRVAIPTTLQAVVGRPTFAGEDIALTFRLEGSAYRAEQVLESGPWRLFIDAIAQDGTIYKKRLNLVVKP